MSSSNLNDFVEILRSHAVIPADAPPAPEEGHDRPWFIALLQGFAGWLAGVFLVFLMGLMLRPSSFAGFLVLGIVLLLAAWTIYQLDRKLMFLDQLAMAISIAGQMSVAASVLQEHFSGLLLATTVLALQLVVFVAMPNRAARTVAALFASIAWVYTIRFVLRPVNSGEEFFGFDESRGADSLLGTWSIPLGWLLTWIPVIAAVSWLLHREARWMASAARDFARPALVGMLLGLAVAGVATEPFATLLLGPQAMGVALSWWALFPLLSIGLAAFTGYAAFQLRSAGLLGCATLAVLLNLSRFYYLYGTTLLWKSLIMLVVGAVLLGAGLWWQRRAFMAGAA